MKVNLRMERNMVKVKNKIKKVIHFKVDGQMVIKMVKDFMIEKIME